MKTWLASLSPGGLATARAALILSCLLAPLAGCAAKVVDSTPPSGTAYVVLPANFIIDLAAGAKARLNPAFQEFIIYPSQEEAREALEDLGAEGGDWRIYILEGNFADLAEPKGRAWRLAVSARAVDWLPDSSEQ